MAAPIPAFVQLADDVANTGEKIRIDTRVVGANVVGHHWFVPISSRSKKVFHYSPALQSVQASAQDAVATGYFWFQVPSGNAWDVAIRKCVLRFVTTNVLTSSVPRILLSRFTFTGAPSGATVTPAKRKSAESATADMRTAVTGMTVTLGATVATFLPPQMHAAGQFFGPPAQEWPSGGNDPFEDDDVILAPTEGVLLYQPDAGTASDPRRFTVDLRIEEVER